MNDRHEMAVHAARWLYAVGYELSRTALWETYYKPADRIARALPFADHTVATRPWAGHTCDAPSDLWRVPGASRLARFFGFVGIDERGRIQSLRAISIRGGA